MNIDMRNIRAMKTRAKQMEKVSGCLRANALTILSVLGVVSGGLIAIILRTNRDTPFTEREIAYVSFPGDLFLRMLKALIIPLIVSSLTSAIGSLDLKLSGKIGARAVVYYLATTVCAVVLGIVLAVSIQPGRYAESVAGTGKGARPTTTADMLMDLIRNLFPPNLIQACIGQYKTVLKPPSDDEFLRAMNATEGTVNRSAIPIHEWKMSGEYESTTNILGLVVFSLVLGVTLGKMGAKGKILLDFFTAISEAFMIITGWVINLSPIGVLFLVCAKVLEMQDFEVVFAQLGLYFLTVLLGFTIHGLFILPLIFFISTRKLPFQFIGNMAEALATAFATGSSSATLPVALKCLEEKNNIDSRVARFVMPIGATINMDGTALYEAVAALFIAQVRGVNLSLGKVIAISITSTAASIGAAGIPQAGLVTLVMVLDTVGLPAEDVTLIIAIDWLVDRFRTMINVLGDALGAYIVNHLSKKELSKSTTATELPLLDKQYGTDLERESSNLTDLLEERTNKIHFEV